MSSQTADRRLYKIGWGEGGRGEGKKLPSQGLHTNHNFGSMQAWTHSSLNIPFFRKTILHHLIPNKGSNSLITGHFWWSVHLTTRSTFVHFVQPLFNYMLGPVVHIISNRLRHFKSWREFMLSCQCTLQEHTGAMNSDTERKDVTPLILYVTTKLIWFLLMTAVFYILTPHDILRLSRRCDATNHRHCNG